MINIQKLSRIALYCATLTTAILCPSLSYASPYASSITYNPGTGVVSFYLNESGGNVTVTYEDGTTNTSFDGITAGTNVAKGLQSFVLPVGHVGYAISVSKIGNGISSQISVDTDTYSKWNSPRGVAINQNPKIGSLFGRVYVDNSAAGTQAKGVFALNPDLSLIVGSVGGTGAFVNSGSSGPWHLRVAPDNRLVVGDYSGNGTLYTFAPDLSSSNTIFQASQPAGIHGDMIGTAHISGSLANSNLVLWIADSGMAVPTLAQDPALVLGPGTSPGMYNNVYRYDIGAGPLPWTNGPNYAFNLGLDVIPELIVDSDVAPDGKIFPAFGRSNLSNPNVTVLDPTGENILWTSWVDTGGNGDPWRGDIIGSTVEYPYGGVRVSPDDKFFASMGIDNAFLIAKLTNGIPDDNTLFVITNASNVGNARGMDWDIADNIYGVSSGQGLLRIYSLGISATCVTSNDITGTNGTFALIVPPMTATAVATTPNASQGYGSPTTGVVTIGLTTNILTVPVTVGFTHTGTASYVTNYTLNIGTNADGVIITSTNVIFPAGTYPHGGNWSVNLLLTPTPIPLSGPTLIATFQILGGASYLAGTPSKANISIINTGPQLLTLSVLSTGSTMSRAVTNDYVTFLITRYGDTTVPTYTVTNINYSGTATYPLDYTAQAQRFTGSLLSDGSPGITINSGEVLITNAIGNPLMRANINLPATNVTIVLSLTNALTGTNVTSSSGYSYVVATNAITLTELDNAFGNRVALWSNSLNSQSDSTNWTLTYASENLGTNTRPPVVVTNYINGVTSVSVTGGSNDFDVEFGYPLPASIPASPAMIANGWTNVLMMTVNKNQGTPAGVNLYPQGQKFNGNYALRFSMYLSIWSDAIGNNYAGAIPREYAIFGVNHTGTNCNWRPSRTAPAGTSGTTNADGIWFAIDAADNAATPADFDAFTSPGLPNTGVTADFVSNAGSAMRGIFKNPPFVNTENPLGGEPVDQWVDVSVEITKQTNCSIYINGAPVLNSFSTYTNTTSGVLGYYTNGTVMLGYLDPDASIGDASSQFVYYSNIRAVELSPYITTQAKSFIVTNGANVSFAASATYATAPITNTWYQANTNPAPLVALQTDTSATTNLTSILSLTGVQTGTNYLAIFSDAAGSVTGLVAQLEVITGPTNIATNAGVNVQFVITPNGPAAPTAYQWYTNGVKLVNGTHYAGVTTATLIITNAQLSDAVIYTVGVTNAAGFVTPSATLTLGTPASPTLSGVSLVGTNAVLTFTSPNSYDNTGSYMLLSSPKVQGPYVGTTSTVTGSSGTFQIVVPLTTNATMFYRLQHN